MGLNHSRLTIISTSYLHNTVQTRSKVFLCLVIVLIVSSISYTKPYTVTTREKLNDYLPARRLKSQRQLQSPPSWTRSHRLCKRSCDFNHLDGTSLHQIYTTFGSGIGTTNLPPAARYSSCCFKISVAKFQASSKTASGWSSTNLVVG